LITSFEKGQQLDSSNAQFRTWIRKCDAELDTENGATSMVVEKTTPPTPTPTPASTPSTPSTPAAAPVQPAPTLTAAPTPKPPEKVRHEWYQTNTHIIITIFAKNVQKSDCTIDLQEKSMSASIKLSDASEFQLNFDLFDKIVPSQSTTTYMSTKIEIKLKKANQFRWKDLEGTGENIPTPVQQPQTTNSTNSQASVTSAYTTKKNWDKIAKDVAEEKLEGEESLNKLFQDIYGNGSDEQKRAMMKSFLESGGTVLSTNWG